MKIVYLGDVVGRSGRNAVLNNIEIIKEKYHPDTIIVNGENAAHGFGITPKICNSFFSKGVDIIVTGNHAYKNKEIIPFMNENKRIIRPLNFPDNLPGKGFCEYELLNGKKILVVQLQGRVFMEPIDCPLTALNKLLKNYILGGNIQAIIVDIHAEATSEKLAIGYYLDGRVSGVFGTHTHVATADTRILPKGTAYQTDVGMCGDFNSVLGSKPEEPINRVLCPASRGKLEISDGQGSVFGVFVETDDKSGLATMCEQIIIHP